MLLLLAVYVGLVPWAIVAVILFLIALVWSLKIRDVDVNDFNPFALHCKRCGKTTKAASCILCKGTEEFRGTICRHKFLDGISAIICLDCR